MYMILWDPAKNRSNLTKHGVGFEEAASCLYDSGAMVLEEQHASGEDRWVLLGLSSRTRLLVVVYAMAGEEEIRIISARKATPREAAHYA